MSFIGDAIGDVVGGITGSKQAAEAGKKAGAQQAAASQTAIDEQRRQFDKVIELMAPYVSAGQTGLTGQQNLIGLNGTAAQQAALDQLANSPLMAQLAKQGESAMLQNASATGGLRGGNLQGALAQYRPQLLNQIIEQQYGRLGGLTQLGQASAANQAAQGMSNASNISNLLTQQGAAIAGGTLAAGSAVRNTFGDILNVAKVAALASAGGAPPPPAAPAATF